MLTPWTATYAALIGAAIGLLLSYLVLVAGMWRHGHRWSVAWLWRRCR
jgi:hypothetical protein